MSMIKHAVALALAGAALSTAQALPLSSYVAGTTPTVLISGSTALDNTLTNAAIQNAPGQTGVCTSGTTDIYLVGSSHKLILCTATAAAGVSGTIAIIKESTAGSANGVQPLVAVAKGGTSGLSFMNPVSAAGDAGCTASVTTLATGDFGQYNTHAGCTATSVTTTNGVPTIGFADVEAAILKTPTGGLINTTDVNANLTNTATVDQVWAVPVTKALYYALQDAEGLTATCPASFSLYGAVVAGSTFAGRDSPSCAPTLSRAQLASVFAGNIFSGSSLGVAANATDDTIYICRRDDGSGSEASFEAYFLGQRCGKTGLGMQTESGPSGSAVWASGSGGGVRSCLQAFQVGGKTLTHFDTTVTPATVTTPAAGGLYAIGVLNTEVTASNLSGAGDAFRMVAIDGVLPQISNVQNGTYPFFSTGSAYQIKGGKPGAPSGAAATLANNLVKLIGHPIWTADSNTNYSKNPWGVTGDVSPAGIYAATNAPTLPATHTSAASNPTNAFSKSASGSINNCDVPQFDSTDLAASPVETLLLGTGTVNN